MSSSASLLWVVTLLVFTSTVAWIRLFAIKNITFRVFAAAIAGALLFQFLNWIHVGFWDPFSLIALFVSIPIALLVTRFLALITVRIREFNVK